MCKSKNKLQKIRAQFDHKILFKEKPHTESPKGVDEENQGKKEKKSEMMFKEGCSLGFRTR